MNSFAFNFLALGWDYEMEYLQYETKIMIFGVLKFPKVNVRTLNRWGWKFNHLSMAYIHSVIFVPKIIGIRLTTVKIVGGGWVVYLFWDTVYIRKHTCSTVFFSELGIDKRVVEIERVFQYSQVRRDSVKSSHWLHCCLTTVTNEVLLSTASWSMKTPTWHHLPCMSLWHRFWSRSIEIKYSDNKKA